MVNRRIKDEFADAKEAERTRLSSISNTPIKRMTRAELTEIEEKQRGHLIRGTDELERKTGAPFGRKTREPKKKAA